ncbi:M3 family oligoendopeptidase [Lederbergia wuyishanensis]|uniref:PepF/M3 family oligoendopeptidase n=1 Tax=Lederbergia wuyishanensis TaxID=1347903 RepID=A0ABU0D1L6_9BACI|nr:M3 family oligoendopeptidase [Lederbergia wuyishanensis]MCJ8006911.1 M3 family oligoendopeptidase [Lederbergia wuyishanensis]MDQ0342295.1 pepF/M3 family oligoendopeptidase [Lederbergia wuyishanensis]
MSANTYDLTWDLDVFFKGGSDSTQFIQHLEKLKTDLQAFEETVESWEIPTDAKDDTLVGLLEKLQKVSQNIRQAGAFVSCLQAQNTNDLRANELRGMVTTLSSKFSTILTNFDEKLSKIDEQIWNGLLNQDSLQVVSFVLNERRKKATEKLPKEQEAIINALSIDGYHGWGEMYDTIVNHVKIPFEENGQKVELSVGQAANKFSNPDPEVRKQVFKEWEKAWEGQSDLLANTLNHLSGFRLSVYKQRGWDHILKEALTYNRMKKETLDVMWEVISDHKQPFADFLQRKAELLGVDKLSWCDLDAPVGEVNTTYSYQEGAEFILKHFQNFGDKLTTFTKKAFEERWIEAEDRPGKQPGGFCTSFPVDDQSRIFMTYSGTPSNVSTLAHELGHAFHSYALKDTHPLNRGYAMNVAETASTFAEMIVSDAAVNNAENDDVKLALLEDKIQRSVALLMNIHARFLFETRFYEERKNGLVNKKRLNELMEQAQKEAYLDSLKEYHPLFWGSKLHFFITGVPFYNFPYTFGFLFSLGIYAQAVKEGKGYERKYMAMLEDTGSMMVEELAEKHLGVDLTKREFWEEGLKLCIKDVEEFMEMTRKK